MELLTQIDPYNNKQITFSECVNLFGNIPYEQEGNNQNNQSGNSMSILDFPKSDAICIEFESNNKIFVRASGTEPLVKVYILYNGVSLQKSESLCHKFENLINKAMSFSNDI